MSTQPTLFDQLPDITRGRHRSNPASVAANVEVHPHKKRLCQQILNYLALVTGGRTCKEIAVALGMGYTTASGRISELKADGLVKPTGVRRDGAAVVDIVRAG